MSERFSIECPQLLGFALRSVIGLEISRHLLDQSDAKLKPIAAWSLAFSRASGRLRLRLSPHWLPVIFILVLIGRCNYFGFGFTTLDRKALYLSKLMPGTDKSFDFSIGTPGASY